MTNALMGRQAVRQSYLLMSIGTSCLQTGFVLMLTHAIEKVGTAARSY